MLVIIVPAKVGKINKMIIMIALLLVSYFAVANETNNSPEKFEEVEVFGEKFLVEEGYGFLLEDAEDALSERAKSLANLEEMLRAQVRRLSVRKLATDRYNLQLELEGQGEELKRLRAIADENLSSHNEGERFEALRVEYQISEDARNRNFWWGVGATGLAGVLALIVISTDVEAGHDKVGRDEVSYNRGHSDGVNDCIEYVCYKIVMSSVPDYVKNAAIKYFFS